MYSNSDNDGSDYRAAVIAAHTPRQRAVSSHERASVCVPMLLVFSVLALAKRLSDLRKSRGKSHSQAGTRGSTLPFERLRKTDELATAAESAGTSARLHATAVQNLSDQGRFIERKFSNFNVSSSQF